MEQSWIFTVLSSWRSYCESSPCLFDECKTAPSGRDVHEAFLGETETLKPETEALTIKTEARPRTRPSELETETRPSRTQLRGQTEPRHYCVSRRPRDRGETEAIKIEATSLPSGRQPSDETEPWPRVLTVRHITANPMRPDVFHLR